MNPFKNLNLKQSNLIRKKEYWFGLFFALLIVFITLIINTKMVSILKEEEANKVKEYAKAQELLSNNFSFLSDVSRKYLIEFLEKNKTVPVYLLDKNHKYIDSKNVSKHILKDSAKLNEKIENIVNTKSPIVMTIFGEEQYIYFENSKILDQLQFYPIAVVIVIFSFVFFFIAYSNSLEKAEKNNLWVGMARETAHQIGTPLSSIMGWTELLKSENVNPIIVVELEKDIERLKTITNRFSKIGSSVELNPENIIQVVKTTIDYLQNRLSKNVKIDFSSSKENIAVNLNPVLIGWVIENLIKNSVDSMHNRGEIKVEILDKAKEVDIFVKDSGSGIEKSNLQKIFSPGFTTKKRGWGLGLSLAKRIIENYHKGEIAINYSNSKMGTEIKISLKKYLV